MTVVLVVIIVVLAAVLAAQSMNWFQAPPSSTTPPPPTPGAVSISALSATSTAGQPLTFTAKNLQSGDTLSVNWGDGVTTTGINNATFQHTYTLGGSYLLWFRVVAANGTVKQDSSQALYKVTVLPDVPLQLGQFVAVPTIYFNNTLDPTAPIVAPSTTLHLYGAFTESSQLFASSNSFFNTSLNVYSNTSIGVSIDHYVWDFGGGHQVSLAPDADGLPATNPENQSFSSGLNAVTLTLYTVETLTTSNLNMTNMVAWTNSTTINTFSVTVGQTIPTGSYKIATASGNVPSPGTITEIVNSGGGPYSFDPQIDYESVGYEVVVNTMADLLFYNGSSTTDWIPYAASEVPSVANGDITNNYTTYNFKVRSNMAFSNGDPLTAYDVYYSAIRGMLFQGGYPGTSNWILAQYILPHYDPTTNTGSFIPFAPLFNTSAVWQPPARQAEIYSDILHAVTYDQTGNNVTFHLNQPTAPSLFFTAISDTLGQGIMDASWLESIGAGIGTFSVANFMAYQSQANEGNYNLQAQFSPVASGPYEINSYVPSTAVVLTPNPGYPGLPMIPKQNNTVVIEWVSSPAVVYQKFLGGEGDIIGQALPPPYFKVINDTMVTKNAAIIQGPFPSITEFFAPFNVNIDTSSLGTLGSYSIPSDYFANPYIREAFAYAFDYVNYVDNILGNKRYGFDFGSNYCGVIVKGLPDYVPPENLTGCPTYDLSRATSLLYLSGEYNTTVNFPVIMPTGDTTDFTAAVAWGQALASIDSHITMTPLYQDFSTIIGDQVPGSDPMPLFFLGWIADYPYPSDYTDAMLQQGGTYPAPNGWDPGFLGGLAAAHPSQASLYNGQASMFSAMSALLTAADAATNPTQAGSLYAQAEQLSISLYMYVYTYQATAFWIVKPYIHPFQNNWGFQENPTIGAGTDSVFFWWTKG